MEITQGLRDSPVRLPESTILGYRSKDASIRLALNRALLMARVQPINEGESPTGGKIADSREFGVNLYDLLAPHAKFRLPRLRVFLITT